MANRPQDEVTSLYLDVETRQRLNVMLLKHDLEPTKQNRKTLARGLFKAALLSKKTLISSEEMDILFKRNLHENEIKSS